MFSKSLIIFKRIKNLNTFFRRIILIFIDSILILTAVFFNFSLYDVNNFIDYKWTLPTTTIIGILIYISTGQYNSLSRYQSSDLIYKLSARNFLILILSSLFGITFELTSPTFSNWVLVWFLINIMTISFRLLLRDFLFSISFLKKRTKPEVVIYGAGDAGIQLLSAFRITQRFNVKAFIDDNPDLFNRYIYGVPIRPRSFLEKSNTKIERLFLAIPSLNYQKKISLLNELQRYSIPVFQIPSLENLTSGSLKIDDVRPININDLLSRKSVKALT